jgi:hypothetical protein
VIIIKPKLFGQNISITISRRKGFAIPELAPNYVISEVKTNYKTVLTLTFSDFPVAGGSTERSATIDNIAPPPPPNFIASVSDSNVILSWGTSLAPDVLRYKIYRTASPEVQIASLPKTATSYVDIGAASLSASYSISVYDSIGNESPRSHAGAAMCIYVDDDGSDSTGDGTLQNPFATIGKAVLFLPDTPATSYTISIFPGEYEEHVELKKANRAWTAAKRLSFKPRYNTADSMPLWLGPENRVRPFICHVPANDQCLEIMNEDYVTVEGLRFAAALLPDSAEQCHGRH